MIPLREEDRKALSKNTDRVQGKYLDKSKYPPDATHEIMPHDAVRMAWIINGKREWSVDVMESFITIRWNHNPKTLERMKAAKA